MSATWISPDRTQFLWPATGAMLGALVAINPFYQPRIPLSTGVGVWFLAMAVAMLLSVHPIAARFGSVVIGVSLAVPCFLYEVPLLRGLLMCGMAFPLVVIAVPLLAPANATYRERMAYLFTWLGTREVKRRPWRFNVNSLIHLVAATIVLYAGAFAVKATPVTGAWLPLRWLAGGTMIFAFAEVVTAGHDFVTALM